MTASLWARKIVGKITARQYLSPRMPQLATTSTRSPGAAEQPQRTEAADLEALTTARSDVRYLQILIHEVNHRTKNALQLAIGALSIEAHRAANAVIRDALQAAISRIKHVNEVHTLLAHRDDPDVIDLSDYMHRLTKAIMAAFAAKPVALHLDLPENVAWPRELVVTLGLIVDEALTNTFKHGFPEGKSGQIRIQMHVERNGLLQLQIEDNGVGIPPDLPSGALGLGLIERFAQRLKGQAILTKGPGNIGTAVKVIFPAPSLIGGGEHSAAILYGFAPPPSLQRRSRAD